MKKFLRAALLTLPVSFSLFSSCAQSDDRNKTAVVQVPVKTEVKKYNGTTLNIPEGWRISEAGNCSDLSFITWDPARPARQVFFYGFGPVFYLSDYQKQVDNNYIRMGGMRTPLTGQPVIAPTTPENFIKNFYRFTEVANAQQVQKLPEMYNVQVISVTPQVSGINAPTATCALVRAVFTDRNRTTLSEGLFTVTLVSMQIALNGPGANAGLTYCFTGITAPFNELDALLPTLNNCLNSFTIDDSYVRSCIQASDASTAGILKAGRTLSEASSNLTKAWTNRSNTEDIASQKWSDAMMGRQRLYDPQTKTVYQVDNNFTSIYNTSPDKFNLKNLQPLPANDASLWKQPLVNGADYIKRINQ